MNTKILAVVLAVIIIVGGAAFFFLQPKTDNYVVNTPTPEPPAATPQPAATTTPTPPAPEVPQRGPETKIGTSVDGNPITAYHFGTGETELLFIGGVHGGYSWNTAQVATELINHLKANPSLIPENVSVTVIPLLNPDGLKTTIGTTNPTTRLEARPTEEQRIAGRFNANNVDLNRNFDCEWQAEGVWQSRKVSGGTDAFSEPESQALRDYIGDHRPNAVVVWYSAANGVYASNCKEGVLPGTTKLLNIFADASGYQAYNEFNYYEITGDMVNWLAKIKIPAISVLLSSHESTDWEKNKAGIEAMLASYAE